MRMMDDGVPLPPCEWAIEPQGLGLGVMAARTLFSDSQSQLVARVLNNLLEPKSLSANSLLSMAELVQCLSNTGCELDNLMFADSNALCDCMLSDESVVPVSSSLQPATVPTDGTELCALSVSAATLDATDPESSSSAGDEQDHISSLLRGLPSDLTHEQRDRAETFIRSHANCSPGWSTTSVVLTSFPTTLTRVSTALISSSHGVTQPRNFRLSTSTFSTCWNMTSSNQRLRLGALMW